MKKNSVALEAYFYEHYADLITYMKERNQRLANFRSSTDEMTKKEAKKAWSQHCRKETKRLIERRNKPKIRDYKILTQIGQGGYGQVYLAKNNDKMVALKKMSKACLVQMNEVEHILTEREILKNTKSQWLVKLYSAFQDKEHVYFSVEYCQGGDLRTHLSRMGCFEEEDAKFYFAEMLLAVNELHFLGFIHRYFTDTEI